MKKRGWILLLVVIAYLAFVGVDHHNQKKKERQEREYDLEIQYKWQNRAIPRKGGDLNVLEYSPYEKVNEKELYIRLTVYNQAYPEEENLKMEDIKEYLEKEHNEDGSLRVETGYEKIHDYIEWYGHGGAEKVEDYKGDLQRLLPQGKILEDLTREQLEELITKEAEKAYEINTEIMEGGK